MSLKLSYVIIRWMIGEKSWLPEMALLKNNCEANSNHDSKSKKDCKDQGTIQSSTTLDPGYHMLQI